MPRRPTMVAAIRKWQATQKWLSDEHAPQLMTVVMLSEALDEERATKGKVSAATASAHRLAFLELQRLAEAAFIPPAPSAAGTPATPAPTEPTLFGVRTDLS